MDEFAIGLLIWLAISPFFLLFWVLSRRKLASANTQIIRQETLAREAEDRASEDIAKIRKKYAPVISQEEEVARLQGEATGLTTDIGQLRSSYAEKRTLFGRLQAQVAVYDERLAFAELGVYEPHFDFGDSETYKQNIMDVRKNQKAMISAKQAAICPADWTVDGSKAKGQVMVNRQMRLTLRAFNNECEAAIANARWNNAVAMERRILAATKAINKENISMNLTLNDDYVTLKVEELRLTHEYREQLKTEKDERMELARSEREEKKLLAQAVAAEREEMKYQTLLEKVRKEAGADGGSEEFMQKIRELETALEEAHATSERARAMAEMTRSGFVYVISNVGSFGEDVVKIGLTRRMDPNDRVRELGDASVPFGFDTHAMIYSEEAPELEKALHQKFDDRRVNMSNMRKEFFRVTLDEIEDAVLHLAPDASFFKDREAQEWQETIARRNKALQSIQNQPAGDFPASI